MKRIYFYLVVFSLNFNTLLVSQVEKWQGNLAVKEGWAPFDLIQKMSGDTLLWEIHNGMETIKLDQIVRLKDSLYVSIPAYDTHIRTRIFADSMSGRFYKNYIGNDPGIEFKAYKGLSRFPIIPNRNISIPEGRWEINFEGEQDRKVGVFVENNGSVEGSVLSSSGDMRFLSGTQTKDGFVVSTFTGLSAYLLDVKVLNDRQWEGVYYTSKSKIHFTANFNPKASLENPYLITKMKPGFDSLSFKLKDLDGNWVSLKDEKFKNKVVIVSILGSWCPNCLDEHTFLSNWYRENRLSGVELVGLAFERKDDPVYAAKFLSNLKSRLKIEYPLLFGGKVGAVSTQKVLPEIEQIKIYPTTLFIGKDGKVAKIHTGYSGPATGLFYQEFKKEFNEIVLKLLQK